MEMKEGVGCEVEEIHNCTGKDIVAGGRGAYNFPRMKSWAPMESKYTVHNGHTTVAIRRNSCSPKRPSPTHWGCNHPWHPARPNEHSK